MAREVEKEVMEIDIGGEEYIKPINSDIKKIKKKKTHNDVKYLSDLKEAKMRSLEDQQKQPQSQHQNEKAQQLKSQEPKAQQFKAQEPKVQQQKPQEPRAQEPKAQLQKALQPEPQVPEVQQHKAEVIAAITESVGTTRFSANQ